MREGTIGRDWALIVLCLGDGDISRGGVFWDEPDIKGQFWGLEQSLDKRRSASVMIRLVNDNGRSVTIVGDVK
jgi:hypothetical protein